MRLPYRVMALVLTGCALETATLQPSGDDFSREPNHRAVVANNIGTIVGDPSKLGGFEISGPRRADSMKGAAWLVCLKSNVQTQPRYHAAFIQNDKLVDSRLAVTIDQCEAQSYTPFNDVRLTRAPVRDDDRKPEQDRR